jgi:hypothetical protein
VLERDELEVTETGDRGSRRGDDGNIPGDRRQRRRGELHPAFQLNFRLPELMPDHDLLAGRQLGRAHQMMNVIAIPEIGRHTPAGGMKVRNETGCFQLGHFVADRRRRDADRIPLRQHLRTDGPAALDIFMNDQFQDRLLTRRQRRYVRSDFLLCWRCPSHQSLRISTLTARVLTHVSIPRLSRVRQGKRGIPGVILGADNESIMRATCARNDYA